MRVRFEINDVPSPFSPNSSIMRGFPALFAATMPVSMRSDRMMFDYTNHLRGPVSIRDPNLPSKNWSQGISEVLRPDSQI